MRKTAQIVLLLALFAPLGCGSNEPTDPAKLAPLTEKDKQEIQTRDEQVNQEEGGSFGKVAKGKTAKK